MSVQIYIKTAPLKELGVRIMRMSEVQFGKEEFFASVVGIPFIMGELDEETIYHDANHWGSSRKSIMAFINKHKLRAGEEWYEA